MVMMHCDIHLVQCIKKCYVPQWSCRIVTFMKGWVMFDCDVPQWLCFIVEFIFVVLCQISMFIYGYVMV
jgi:hypothetical protein